MSKIIYIAGLGHSGSTMLDMSLGTLPGVVGLGELKTLIDDESRDRHYTSDCSCGKKATECNFWKNIPQVLKGIIKEEEKIEVILSQLRAIAGEDVILVDSSKNSYPYLQYLNKQHELTVLYLTRDVRSWSYSRHLSSGKPVLYFIIRWYLENIKLLTQLKRMGIAFMKVGYEELALYPEHVLPVIASYAGLSYSDKMLTPDKTGSHIISGNVARADKEKRTGWKYDARWLLSKRIMLLSPLLLLIQKRNKIFVYQNVNGRSTEDFYLFGTRRREYFAKKHN